MNKRIAKKKRKQRHDETMEKFLRDTDNNKEKNKKEDKSQS